MNVRAERRGLQTKNLAPKGLSPSQPGALAPGRHSEGGHTWRPVNAGLPLKNGSISASVLSLAILPDYASDSTLFVGLVDYGVYRSVDGGESWGRCSSATARTIMGRSPGRKYLSRSRWRRLASGYCCRSRGNQVSCMAGR